jgi:hypothetical protein
VVCIYLFAPFFRKKGPKCFIPLRENRSGQGCRTGRPGSRMAAARPARLLGDGCVAQFLSVIVRTAVFASRDLLKTPLRGNPGPTAMPLQGQRACLAIVVLRSFFPLSLEPLSADSDLLTMLYSFSTDLPSRSVQVSHKVASVAIRRLCACVFFAREEILL